MIKKSFLSILLTLLVSSFAYADCFDECMSIKGCWHKGQTYSSYCGSAEVNCQSECDRKEANAGGRQSFGAIAYSAKDGSYGYSDNQDSRDAAENVAMNFCRQYGGENCRAMVWFLNSCGAVAADGNKTGWGQADSEEEAQRKALKKCGRKKCQVQVTHCSF